MTEEIKKKIKEARINFEKTYAGSNFTQDEIMEAVLGFIEGARQGYALAEARIKELEGLLERASWLVGNPATNISSSTDLACDSWQEDYKKLFPKP